MSLSAGCAMANTDSSASAENAPKSIGMSGIRRHIRRWYRGNEVGHACSVPNLGVRHGAARALLEQMLADVRRHLEHRQLLVALENRKEIGVGANDPAILGVLQVVLADVLPQLAHRLAARQRLASDDVCELRSWCHHAANGAACRAPRSLRRLNDALLALFFSSDRHAVPA